MEKMNYERLIGRTVNFLTVISLDKPTEYGNPQVNCLCICGKRVVRSAYKVAKGVFKSCGCKRGELTSLRTRVHGKAASKIYLRWRGMLNRCYRLKDIEYSAYGGSGIRVCKEWHQFENFYTDMGDPPSKSHLDRIDNDADYSPANCRWVSHKLSAQNTRSKILWTVFGEEYLDISEAATKYAVARHTIARWCGRDKSRPHAQKPNCSARLLYNKRQSTIGSIAYEVTK